MISDVDLDETILAIREIFGLVLIAIALVLMPVSWMTSRVLWFVAFAMFVGGLALVLTDRVARRMAEADKEGSRTADFSARTMPTDLYNYTGWRSGGRSETMDNLSHTGDGGDAWFGL